jgi:rhodanese-related sulfurtransferase
MLASSTIITIVGTVGVDTMSKSVSIRAATVQDRLETAEILNEIQAKAEANEDEWQRKVSFYQKRFPVPSLTSGDLLNRTMMMDENDNNHYILLDVRTSAERKVSILPGALSLQEFKQYYDFKNIQRRPAKEISDTSSNSSHPVVVAYCTVGYRSGLEATRLQDRYPALRGKIYNLDGIVAYTHALTDRKSMCHGDNANSLSDGDPCSFDAKDKITWDQQQLVDPVTGQPTDRVHTFGPMWDYAAQGYRTTHFSLPVLLVRFLQVGGLVMVRTIQRAIHCTRHSCQAMFIVNEEE